MKKITIDDGTLFPNAWGERLKKSIFSQLKMNREIYILGARFDVISQIEEYHKLTPRYWSKKRKLEKSIANMIIYWLDDIKKIQSEESIENIIKVPRIK